MSGRRSTRSWLYENRPSTHRAAITIVANTGLAMETRVNHMTRLRSDAIDRCRGGRRRIGRGALHDHLGGCAFLQVVEARGQHDGVGREAPHHLDLAAPGV